MSCESIIRLVSTVAYWTAMLLVYSKVFRVAKRAVTPIMGIAVRGIPRIGCLSQKKSKKALDTGR